MESPFKFSAIIKGVKITIRVKLFIIFTLLVAIISAFIYVYFPIQIEKQAIRAIADKTKSIADMTAFNVSAALVFEDRRDMADILESVRQNKDLAYFVVLNQEDKIFASFNYAQAEQAGYRITPGKNPINEEQAIYRAISPIIHKKKKIGKLLLGVSLKALNAQIEKSKRTITLVSLIIFSLGALLVFLFSMVITKPLAKIIATIKEISRGDLSRRVPVIPNNEIGTLAVTFNFMVENLESYSQMMSELNQNLENKVSLLQREIRERQLAEEALKRSEAKYKRLVNNSLVGIYIAQEHKLKFCNQWFAELFGYSEPAEISEKNMKELLTEESWNLLESIDRPNSLPNGKESKRYELKAFKKGGMQFDIEVLNRRITYHNKPAIEGILLDISARKQAEAEKGILQEQLRQAQKMESLGTLAGGIAHDFNNILSAIMGFTELTLETMPPGSEGEYNLKRVMTSSVRAKDMVKRILMFSRKGNKERKPLWISDLLDEALTLMRATLPSTIEIRKKIIEPLRPVMADKAEIHQVIMNICTNANHAMRENGGVLTFSLRGVNLEPDSIDRVHLKAGSYQQLTISDTGHGIPPEILPRIFEPYFTTKKKEEGIGMGLAMVHGIIRNYGGDITVYSEPGKGSTFHIFLPSSRGEVEKEPEICIESPETPARGEGEHVLFVDDEPYLAELGQDMLKKLGYKVFMTTESRDAFKTFSLDPHRFDIVVSDQTMPRMTGLQLAARIKEIRSDIPVLLCSGFSENLNEENYQSLGIDGFIMKPIVKSELAQMIRKTLDRKS